MIGRSLFWSLVGIGCLFTVLAGLHVLYPVVALALLAPLFFIFSWWKNLFLVVVANRPHSRKYRWAVGLFLLLLGIWMLHFLQVLVPETGFDAVWYHLPVADAISQAHGLVVLPDLYQSINPLFGDLFFVVGYQVLGAGGAKLVAYLSMLAVLVMADELFLTLSKLRGTVSLLWRLLLLCSISLFQVVAWQSASFYVDGLHTFFLVAVLWAYVKNDLPMFALALGAIVGIKAFSVVTVVWFVAFWVLRLMYKKRPYANFFHDVFFIAVCVLSIGGIWYLRAWQVYGSPLYVLGHHIDKSAEIGQSAFFMEHVIHQLLTILFSPFTLLTTRDYVAPVTVFLTPVVIWYTVSIWKKTSLVVMPWLFVAQQWLLWWLVPPLSTRYALAGFIVLCVLVFVKIPLCFRDNKKYPFIEKALFVVLFFQVLLLLTPRLLVAKRSLEYLFVTKKTEMYLLQFTDGWIDQHLVSWHSKHSNHWRP